LNAERPAELLSYGSDLLDTLAALMLDRHQPALPDLSRIAVVFPSPHAIPRFRRLLLEHAERRGYSALLPPWYGTLDGWLAQTGAPDGRLVSETERELLLLDALRPYPTLRERFGTWSLIGALLSLFDEINAQRLPIPDSPQALATALANGYGADPAFEPLRGEAELVHQLWSAWNGHLLSQSLLDEGLQRLARLGGDGHQEDGAHLYIVSMVGASRSEAEWLKSLMRKGRATLLLQTGAPMSPIDPPRQLLAQLAIDSPPISFSSNGYALFLDNALATEPNLATRAREFRAAVPQSPATSRLSYYEAVDFEQEARAVEIAIRHWLAQGVSDIGLVTEDRKLARRVRALLERANVPLRDTAGWALSTTSAAAVLMRWIDCVEQNFAHAPLLDLLKSPFVTLGFTRERLDELLAILERDVIRRHNITGDLARHRRLIGMAGQQAEPHHPGITADLNTLCDRLTHASEPLLASVRGEPRSPYAYIRSLYDSLERLELAPELSRDDAGQEILSVLRQNRQPKAALGDATLAWVDFRQWLVRELERRRFRPGSQEPTNVELVGLADSRCLHFQALVIAGCNRDQMPGPVAGSPFFNDAVRKQLGLPSSAERLAISQYDFRRLLEAAPQIVITRHRTERGEATIPATWVERLVAFHRLAYGSALSDETLPALLRAPETELFHHEAALPTVAQPPRAHLPRSRIPTVYSASSQQRLIDCPYQFFATDGLGLRPMEPVREELEKLDYGQRLHHILHAFHGGVPGLPGPWTGGAIDASNREQAAELLHEIGRIVFEKATDSRLSARGWRYRWDEFIPVYLDWQEARSQLWSVERTEAALERQLTVGETTVLLRGRADRIERGASGSAILDYKTGAIPEQEAVIAGEHAQLAFYALLSPGQVSEVGYLHMDNDGIKTRSATGDAVTELAKKCEARLRTMIEALYHGEALPAWGDTLTCRYCKLEGLCRKEMWDAAS
jgi:ATP-dependent helicase/nuclease subunit B